MSQNEPDPNNDTKPYIGCLSTSLGCLFVLMFHASLFLVLSWVIVKIMVDGDVGIKELSSRIWHFFDNTRYGIDTFEFSIGLAFLISLVVMAGIPFLFIKK